MIFSHTHIIPRPRHQQKQKLDNDDQQQQTEVTEGRRRGHYDANGLNHDGNDDDDDDDVEDMELEDESGGDDDDERDAVRGRKRRQTKSKVRTQQSTGKSSNNKRKSSSGGGRDSSSGSGSSKRSGGGGGGNMSFRDASVAVLRMMQRPMTAKDIAKIALEKQLVKSSGKTPDRTVAALIYQEMNRRKEKSAFVLANKGIFGLREFSDDVLSRVDSPAERSPRRSASASRARARNSGGQSSRKRRRRRYYDTDEEEEEEEEAETTESDESTEEDEADDRPVSRRVAMKKRTAGKAPRNAPLQRNDLQRPSGNTTNSVGSSMNRGKSPANMHRTSPVRPLSTAFVGDQYSSENDRPAPASTRRSYDMENDIERSYSSGNTTQQLLQQQPYPQLSHLHTLKPQKPPRTDLANYDDDYGYMYLRYFLDLSRRQEEGDLTVSVLLRMCSKNYYLS